MTSAASHPIFGAIARPSQTKSRTDLQTYSLAAHGIRVRIAELFRYCDDIDCSPNSLSATQSRTLAEQSKTYKFRKFSRQITTNTTYETSSLYLPTSSEMSAYAILGATGSMGSSILQLLSAAPNNKIHVLVRSRAKLEKLIPSVSSNPNIKIFEGSISNAENLAQCLRGVKAVFLTVAVVKNIPGCSIAQDTARAVVTALTQLKDEDPTFRSPRLVVLSSASVDDKFWNGIPAFVHHTLFAAMYYVYTDLQKAQSFLQTQDNWISSTFITPGGISHDVQRGHTLSESEQQTFISFLDVAAGMIEVADEESGRWDGKLVCVVGSSGVKARIPWSAPLELVKGLVWYWCPWMYAYLS